MDTVTETETPGGSKEDAAAAADPSPAFQALLPAVAVRAAALFTGKEASRPALSGVAIEPYREGVVMVATNGHTMFVVYDEHAYASAAGIITINSALLGAAGRGGRGMLAVSGGRASLIERKWAPQDEDDRVSLLQLAETPDSWVTHHQWDHTVMDRPFVDWRRILSPPSEDRASGAAFNAKYLDLFGRAFVLLGYGGVAAISTVPMGQGPSENAPHYVRCIGDSSAFGVIMPMRPPSWDAVLPSWWDPDAKRAETPSEVA